MKRTGLIAAALSICLLAGCASVADYRVNRQLKLGDRYLVEFEYDKAMLAYSKALLIEPKQMAAYRGLSDAFTAQHDIGSSINVLKKGLAAADDMTSQERDDEAESQIRGMNRQIVVQLTDMGDQAFQKGKYSRAITYYKDLVIYDAQEEDSYLKLSEAYEELGDLEQALKVLQEAEVETGRLARETERLAVRYAVKKEYEELLERLGSLIRANDGQLAKEVLLTQDFLDLVAKLEEPLIMQQNSDQYVAVYPNGYVYIGQMAEQKRSGYGDYYTNNQDRYVVYSGQWKEDKPNGNGRIDTVVYTNLSNRSPNFCGNGYFENGVSEGSFSFSVYYQNGSRYDYVFSNSGGIPPSMGRRSGRNLVGYAVNDSSHYFLLVDSGIFAVPNFETEGYSSVFVNVLTTH